MNITGMEHAESSYWIELIMTFGSSCSLAHQQTDSLILHQPAWPQTRLGLSTAGTGVLVVSYCD